MTITLLILGGLLALPLTAVGLPGMWIYLAIVGLWKIFNEAAPISWTAFLVAFALACIAEAIEFALAARYTTKYGGSKRAGWGAIIGGIIGAVVGVPVPVAGSIIGSFAGAFLGALVGEYSVNMQHGNAGRVAYGALVGRVIAMGVKVSITFAIVILLVFAALG
ncbi:MAG: DUF456 family protein [Gemmatimonadaceae bacterium]